MPRSDASAPRKRGWWGVCAFGVVATLLIGQKCLCPDPAAALRQQITGSAEVHGTPLRSAAPAQEAVPAPAAAAVASDPPVTPGPAAAAHSPAEALVADYKTIAWDDLSKYRYVPPKPAADEAMGAGVAASAQADQIPQDIRAMSGRRFTIDGYAVPLDYEKGIVKNLILLNAPLACCFAEAPPMNRWMTVTNDSAIEFDYSKYTVIRISGVFDVGEETRDGCVVGIYRMRAEKISVVEE